MEPISLWIVLLCIWSLSRFWLLPIAKDRWVAADMRTKLLKAGSLAVLEKVQDLATVGALVLTVAMLVVWSAGHFAAASSNTPKALVDGVASAYTTVKEFADGFGKLLTVFGIVAAAYTLLRCARNAKRRVSEVWSLKAHEAYARLRENPADIEAARADADLKPIIEHIDALIAELAGLEDAHGRESSTETREKIYEEKREELSAALSALAIEIARKDVTFEIVTSSSEDESATKDRNPWLLRILTGERFCKDAGLIKEHLSHVVTALLFVTLIGWSADPLANSLQLAVNNLRVNFLVEQAHRDLDVALSHAVPEADDHTPSPLSNLASVQAASRMLAHGAMREMLQSSLVDRVVGIERTELSRTEFVRAAIAEQNYKFDAPRAPDVTEKVRKEVANAATHPVAAANDFKSAESKVASALLPSVQRLATENPGRLQRILDQVQARYAAPMAPLDAQGELIGEAMDEAFSTSNFYPSGELSRQADKLMKEFGKKALVEWAQAFAQRFVTQAIVDTAHPEVWARVNDNLRFETSVDTHRLLVALTAAEGRGMHNVAADEEALMDQKVAAIIAKSENDLGEQQALMARMSGYDSLFPSHDDESGLPRMDQPGPGGGGGRAGGGDESGRSVHTERPGVRSTEHIGSAPSFTTARARSFGLASLSFRVRGVLVGQDAESVGIDITDLKWTMQPATSGHPTRVTLQARMGPGWHILGTFDAAVVNQALRYAADGRVVATTITPGDGRALGRLTYVHPALVDTPLGCRIIDADRIIDTFSISDNFRGASPALAQLGADRDNTYYWMRNVRIAERVASMPQDRACPQAQLEQLLLRGDLKQSRFSPALAKSLKDFMDDHERKMPGSTKFLRAATACSAGAVDKFSACLCSSVKPAGLSPRYWFPEDHTSQLRERNTFEKSDLHWMQMSKDGLGNFDLWVHVTFSLRNSNDQQPDEASATALDFPSDELTQLRRVVANRLPDYLRKVENSPSYDDFMGPLEQFVVLQRFARSALSGKLGQDFPASRFVELARVTRPYVPFQRTIRWEPASPYIDIIPLLQQADAHAADAYKSWKESQEDRRNLHKPMCDATSR
ncbi:hypothetical protein WI36_14055 [Burkholderia ubonensis]|uniref:hypothetical protein n=1 Tax=Burkholderia ubonensis TaxID=101571 RepID=UPI00076C2C49|nr:hypothetical protein [Burkholderia ubonensis]KUZ74578.1 hypothetical protein WI36_14055 [Burkholderia ubonensis]